MGVGRQTSKFSDIVLKCQRTVPAVVVLVEGHSTGGDRRLRSRPAISDPLTIIVTYGSSRSMNSHTRNVGTRSSVHDLTGDCIMMRRTSDCVHGLNDGLRWRSKERLLKCGGSSSSIFVY